MSEELYLYLGFSLIKLFVHCLMLELVKNIFFFVGEGLNHRKLIHQYHLESQNVEKYTPKLVFLPRVVYLLFSPSGEGESLAGVGSGIRCSGAPAPGFKDTWGSGAFCPFTVEHRTQCRLLTKYYFYI